MNKDMKLSGMDVDEIIVLLKKKKILEISLYELSKEINKYFPLISQSRERVFRTLRYHESKFIKSGIVLYDYNKRKKEYVENKVELTIKYIKEELKRDKITRKEFIDILVNKYKFKYLVNNNFFKANSIPSKLKSVNIFIVSSSNREQRKNIYKILDSLKSMDEVQNYKKESKEFTITELFNLLSGKISRSCISQHIKYIYDLGVPVPQTEYLNNCIKYDEIDVIKKICMYLKKEEIREITSLDFSKLSKKLKLPQISVKCVFINEKLILEKYKIKVLVKNRATKKVFRDYLQENLEQIKSDIPIDIIKGEQPPLYIVKNDYWVNKNINKVLEENWNSFVYIYLADLYKKRKNVRESLFKDGKHYINTVNKKVMFLYHDNLNIKNLTINDIIKLSYIRVKSSEHVHGVNRQSMMIAFLFYLYSKELILFSFSILYEKHNFQHNISEVETFLTENKIYKKFILAEKENRILRNYKKFRKLFLLSCYSFSNHFDVNDCDSTFFKIYSFMEDRYYNTISNILYSLGAEGKNKNILKNKYVEDYHSYTQINKYKPITKVFNDYMDRKVALGDTKTPESFYKRATSVFSSFIDFLETYYTDMMIEPKELFNIFDYPHSQTYTYQQYLEEQDLEGSSKRNKLSPICEAFSTTIGYKEVFSKDKIPNYPKIRHSERNAIDDEDIINKIDDIVTNRPPKSNYYKNYKINQDTSWWPHMKKVRPFEPLLIKLHLRIPVRGKSIRLIDRDSLLVYDNSNRIKGFRFLSDKNKNRKEPFIVPNIWKNELGFLINLIKYNKEYFPNLKKYYPSDKTLKDGIIPLFPSFDGKQSFMPGQHMLYWTKVLIQAQIEFRKEGRHYTFVTSDKIKIPTTIEELDNITQDDVKKIKKKYDIHSLRHTGITRYIKQGMPLELLRLLTGHQGFNTLLTVYYHIDHEELAANWLSREGIDFTDKLNMQKNSELFLNKELIAVIETGNPDDVYKTLKSYFFFNLQNRELKEEKRITLETISKTEVVFWKPMTYGICTKQQCPLEVINRCSLCPYYITNYLYMEEIGLQMQLSMARVKKYSDLIIRNRERGSQTKNTSLRQSLNKEIESFVGWLEVTNRANSSYNDKKFNDSNKNTLVKTDEYLPEESILSFSTSLNIEHGYLEILSQTFKREQFDNETIKDLINIMANKIIRYSSKNDEYKEVLDYSNDEIIRWFLPKYDKIPKNWNTNLESKKELEDLLKIFDNKQNNSQLEYKNENTFLTE